jgi:septal ring factor EnvC (AmiA/AmiB activator)
MINNTLRSLQHKLEELVESLEGVETEVKRLTVLLNEKERENTNLKAELDELKEMIKSNEIAAEGKSCWYMVLFISLFNFNWVDAQWQQYSSHLNINSTQNTPNRTYITNTNLNMHNKKN